MSALEDVQSTTLHDLYKHIQPAKHRKVPDEIITTIRDAEQLATVRRGANEEDIISHACTEILDGKATAKTGRSLIRTLSWRESAALQVERMARHLRDIGLLIEDYSIDGSDVDDECLSKKGSVYYERVFSGNKLIDSTKIPPRGCIGGPWEYPLTWLSNLVAREKTMSITRLKNTVDDFISRAIIEKVEAGQLFS